VLCRSSDIQYKYVFYRGECKWLVVRTKKLGCFVCAEVSKLVMGPQSGTGVKPSRDCENCEVSYFGDTKKTQLLSLRRKTSEHNKIACYKSRETVQMSEKKKSLETGNNKVNEDRFESTERIFYTAYKVTKMNRLFTDIPIDDETQELNGLDMGRVLHSNGHIRRFYILNSVVPTLLTT
jgi:hypothetical protein